MEQSLSSLISQRVPGSLKKGLSFEITETRVIGFIAIRSIAEFFAIF
jgi:hypothetical protein